ncbi:uncharacterized protein LOC144138726 [Haemaphysalis longicornis]
MKLLVFFVAACTILQGHISAGAAPECFRLSVTNFLDIGTCLANKGDLCSSKSVGVVELVKRLSECFFKGLAKLDLYDQIVILQQFFLYGLERVTAGVGNELLQALCDVLRQILLVASAGLIKVDCHNLELKKKIICDDPIKIGVPATLGIGDCFGKLGEVCVKGKVMTKSTLESTFKLLDCLIHYLHETDPEHAYVEVACFLINLPANIIGGNVGKAISQSLRDAFHVTCH